MVWGDATTRKIVSLLLLTLLILPIMAQISYSTTYSLTSESEIAIIGRIFVIESNSTLHPKIKIVNETYLNIAFNVTRLIEESRLCEKYYDLNLSATVLFTLSTRNGNLSFLKLSVSNNENVSHTSYVLIYDVAERDFNLTVLTQIYMSSDSGEFFLTTIYVQQNLRKTEPKIDVFVFADKIKLSDHYKVLAKLLRKVYIIENKHLWKEVSRELLKLSNLVRKKLSTYDIAAKGITFVFDPGWLACAGMCAVCAAVIGAVIGCAIATMGSGFLACLAAVFGVSPKAIVGALTAGVGIVVACVTCCCCLGYQPCCEVI